jgi:hypothetical protein
MQHYLTTIYPLIEFFKTDHDDSSNIDFSKFNLSFNVDNEILKIGNYFHLGIQQRNIFKYDYIVFGHYHKAINVLFNNGQKYTRFLSPGSLASKYNDTRMIWDNFGPVMIIDTSKETYTHDKYIIAKLAKKFSYQNPAADFMDSLNDNARKILGY